MQVFVNGFGFNDDHLAHFLNDRTVDPGPVVIEFKDPPAIAGYPYNPEGKALPHTRKVQHIPVGGQEGQTGNAPECFNVIHHPGGILREFTDGIIILLVDLSQDFLLQLFLHHPGVGCKAGVIFHVPLNRKGIVGQHPNIVQYLP